MGFTFKGDIINLVGNEVRVGEKAPEFIAIKQDLSIYNLREDLGKVLIISVVPSVDTSVCEYQTTHFNEEATKLHDDVKVLTVSVDLPFAQTRFCEGHGIDRVDIVSDYRDRDFGMKYGFVIDELKLLSRGTIIIDRNGIIQYVEYVQEVSDSVDFEAALNKVRELL